MFSLVAFELCGGARKGLEGSQRMLESFPGLDSW